MKHLLFAASVIAAIAAPIAQKSVKVLVLFDMEGVTAATAPEALTVEGQPV